MASRRLIEHSRLSSLFDEIEPQLYRFPAVDAASFGRRVRAFVDAAE